MVGDRKGEGMSDGAEVAEEAITGGTAARAVEPAAGGKGGHGMACLNCGTVLIGGYCHDCGQSAQLHRSLSAFWHDLAHGVLHFEGKIWRTLPLLALRPGELTRRYIHGERTRFVSPIALFLFSVFLMFAVFHLTGGPVTGARVESDSGSRVELSSERQAAQQRVTKLEQRRAERVAQGQGTAEVDEDLGDARSELAALTAMSSAGPDNRFARKLLENAKENPSLLAYKIESNAYKFSWALIPISVPFVWLLFLFRRRYRAYDHTIFVTYSIAAMTLLAIALSLLRFVGVPQALVMLAIVTLPPVHMYRQLKGAYLLSRFEASWRATMLLFFALVAGGLFFGLLTAIWGAG